jgi:hypothetical protein
MYDCTRDERSLIAADNRYCETMWNCNRVWER